MNPRRLKAKLDGPTLSRRAFSAMLTGGVAAGCLHDAAMQEIRTYGTLTRDRVRDLLVYMGHPAKQASELERLQPLVEDTLRAIQVIRDFEIPIDLEPAVAFSAER